jgi:hypothetical protein
MPDPFPIKFLNEDNLMSYCKSDGSKVIASFFMIHPND